MARTPLPPAQRNHFAFVAGRIDEHDTALDDIEESVFGSPAFVTPQQTITIYVRTTGDDVVGDGSEAAPYAKVVRAVLDIPAVIPPGVRYIIDDTGITEDLPVDYELPPWKASETLGYDQSNPYFLFTAAVQFNATPQLVAAITTEDATVDLAADVASQVANTITGQILLTLNTSRASWAANALKGKFVILTGHATPASVNTTILESTDTTLLLATTAALTTDFTIREPSAWLKVTSVPQSTANRGGLNVYNVDSVAFNGQKITTTTGGASHGLCCNGKGQSIAQMCELDRPQLSSYSPNLTRLFNNWVYGARFRATPMIVCVSTLFDAIGTWVLLNMRFLQIAKCAIIGGVTPECVAQAPGSSRYGDVAGGIRVENTLIRDITGATNDGFRFNGGKAQFDSVDISGCGRDGIRCVDDIGYIRLNKVRSTTPNGVTANVSGTGDDFTFNAGDVTLVDDAALFTPDMVGKTVVIAGSTTPANDGTYTIASVVSTTEITYANAGGVTEAVAGTWTVWTGVGILISDGMQCVVDTNTSAAGSGDVLTGAGGDMKVGTLPMRAWSDFVANAPIKNQFDLRTPFVTNAASGLDLPAGDDVTGAGTGGCSGSRLFQRT